MLTLMLVGFVLVVLFVAAALGFLYASNNDEPLIFSPTQYFLFICGPGLAFLVLLTLIMGPNLSAFVVVGLSTLLWALVFLTFFFSARYASKKRTQKK